MKIEKGDKAGTQKVTFKGKPGITKDQAVKSLGSKASRFVVKELKEESGA